MIDFSDVRIFLCTTPTNMNCSFDHLMGRVQEIFEQDPCSGHLFLLSEPESRSDQDPLLGSGWILHFLPHAGVRIRAGQAGSSHPRAAQIRLPSLQGRRFCGSPSTTADSRRHRRPGSDHGSDRQQVRRSSSAASPGRHLYTSRRLPSAKHAVPLGKSRRKPRYPLRDEGVKRVEKVARKAVGALHWGRRGIKIRISNHLTCLPEVTCAHRIVAGSEHRPTAATLRSSDAAQNGSKQGCLRENSAACNKTAYKNHFMVEAEVVESACESGD